MNLFRRYGLRMKRRRLLWRAFRKRRQLLSVANRTSEIGDRDILAFVTLRNERPRLAYFLDYYRQLGVSHFIMVDNGSTDGSGAFLAEQPDVSLWQTNCSYRRARYGVDWMTWLQIRYGHRHWCLTVDVDEFLVYPFCDMRPLRALTDWLSASSIRSFPAMILDLYPRGPLKDAHCAEGQSPIDVACWFDSGNYTISRNATYGNLWIQGGARARAFFADTPHQAPALNKVPLVFWNRRYVYLDSTHMLLPRGLNGVYDENGGERISGALMHAKLLPSFTEKAREEVERAEHYGKAREYRAYRDSDVEAIWTPQSERFINWRQLEILGLISRGSWA